MLNSAEHEIVNVQKYKTSQEIQQFSGSDKLRMLFSLLINDCWHFNIYEQEKFHALLS